ncbi:hypothetical protein ACCO45_008144 [Purpureocillium lilacinum]|uniref:Uncharacterized protein n=1 Tax=Purpureocillium lilacinum TaxID=33203 RepID=A0ACC4DQ38_PURLI
MARSPSGQAASGQWTIGVPLMQNWLVRRVFSNRTAPEVLLHCLAPHHDHRQPTATPTGALRVQGVVGRCLFPFPEVSHERALLLDGCEGEIRVEEEAVQSSHQGSIITGGTRGGENKAGHHYQPRPFLSSFLRGIPSRITQGTQALDRRVRNAASGPATTRVPDTGGTARRHRRWVPGNPPAWWGPLAPRHPRPPGHGRCETPRRPGPCGLAQSPARGIHPKPPSITSPTSLRTTARPPPAAARGLPLLASAVPAVAPLMGAPRKRREPASGLRMLTRRTGNGLVRAVGARRRTSTPSSARRRKWSVVLIISLVDLVAPGIDQELSYASKQASKLLSAQQRVRHRDLPVRERAQTKRGTDPCASDDSIHAGSARGVVTVRSRSHRICKVEVAPTAVPGALDQASSNRGNAEDHSDQGAMYEPLAWEAPELRRSMRQPVPGRLSHLAALEYLPRHVMIIRAASGRALRSRMEGLEERCVPIPGDIRVVDEVEPAVDVTTKYQLSVQEAADDEAATLGEVRRRPITRIFATVEVDVSWFRLAQ